MCSFIWLSEYDLVIVIRIRLSIFVFYEYGDHRELHVLTHSFPTRRSAEIEENKDGVDNYLFPLIPERTACHEFRLHGEEDYRGRLVYRLTFKPADRKSTRLHSSPYIPYRMPSSA